MTILRSLRFTTSLLGLSFLALAAPRAHAIDCTAGINVTSAKTLTDNYTTSSDTVPCFTIIGGQTLDMNGFSITCTDSLCRAAVKIENDSTASVVRDGYITGLFTYGVDSSANTIGSVTVQNNFFQLGMDYPIYGGTKITGNRLGIDGGGCVEAIHWRPIVSGDYCRDNYIYCDTGFTKGVVADSAVTVGTTSPKLEENFFQVTGDVITTTGNVRVEDNVIIAAITPDPAYTPFTIGANGTVGIHLCDAASGSADLTFNCTFPMPGNLLSTLPAP